MEGSNQPILYPPPEREDYDGEGVAGRRRDPSVADDSFLRVVDRRVSVRRFREDGAVDDGILCNCLRVARLAPSAGNLQTYQVVVVRDLGQRMAIARAAARQTWIADAPVVLVFLADQERSGRKYHDRGRFLYSVQDATVAAAYTQLALEAAGLSSCWVGAFHEDEVAAVVVPHSSPSAEEVGPPPQRPGTLRPVVVMPVGIAAERPVRSHRRPIKKFVHYGVVGSGLEQKSPPLPEHGTKRRKGAV